MSFYKPKLYTKGATSTHAISRSKIDLFLECPRCFYLGERLGVKRPSMASFTLNLAVDALLKKEFDTFRYEKKPHPLMVEHHIDAVPFIHANLETWRENFVGIRALHADTNLTIFGAVDDLWETPQGEIIVVDYKATSKLEVPTLEGRWGEQYKRQVEVYQWLLRKNDLNVSSTSYFVYVNGRKSESSFDGKLLFDTYLIAHDGNDSWIEPVLMQVKKTLESDTIPDSGPLCEYCPYREGAGNAFKAHVVAHRKK